MRILVVEDDRDLADLLARTLREQGLSVTGAYDGAVALERLLNESFDAAVLDLTLPGLDGLEVCRGVRGAGHGLPILMLTARDRLEDRVRGLNTGADDYLVKPFAMEELLARLRALTRRQDGQAATTLCAGSLRLDLRKHVCDRGARRISLSSREFALLAHFMRHPGRILSRTEILEQVWEAAHEGLSNVVDVYINYLRNKLEAHGEPRVLHTVRGRGYVLRIDADGPEH